MKGVFVAIAIVAMRSSTVGSLVGLNVAVGLGVQDGLAVFVIVATGRAVSLGALVFVAVGAASGSSSPIDITIPTHRQLTSRTPPMTHL